MLAAPAEQLRAVDHGLPRRNRAELGDHPAGIRRFFVGSTRGRARLADRAAAAARISAGERILGFARIDRGGPAGRAHSRHRARRLALAGGARERRDDHHPRAGHAGQNAVPRATAADAMLSMPKF
jgi:hypothetical protein